MVYISFESHCLRDVQAKITLDCFLKIYCSYCIFIFHLGETEETQCLKSSLYHIMSRNDRISHG